MFLPASLSNIECQPIACEIVSSIEDLLRRLLSCNQERFSGHLMLTLSDEQSQVWSLYFLSGLLVGGTNQSHAIRRWYRQTARYCPQLSSQLPPQPATLSEFWDYPSLAKRVERGQLSRNQMIGVVRGNLDEMLFDLIQAHHLVSNRNPDIEVSYQDFGETVTSTPPVLLSPSQALRQATQGWNAWSKAGLEKYSPSLVPVIQDAEALRQKTSPVVYQNLTQFLSGNLTLRDLALALKQHLVLLTRSLSPYLIQGIIGLQSIPDLDYTPLPETVPIQPEQPLPSGPCIAYLEDSRFDTMAMGKILEEAGYKFVGIQEPIQALPMLLEHKPELIFLDVLMPVLNGYEVCAQIRQISLFKKTPIIIVTSSDGIVDRVRAKLVGSSDFLAKPITSAKVLATVQKHLLRPSLPPSVANPSPSLPLKPRHSNLSPEILAWHRNV